MRKPWGWGAAGALCIGLVAAGCGGVARAALVAPAPIPGAPEGCFAAIPDDWKKVPTKITEMKPGDAEAGEATLERTPGDLRTRLRLITYYNGVLGEKSPEFWRALDHAKWLVRHCPAAPVFYDDGRLLHSMAASAGSVTTGKLESLWAEAVERFPSNAAVLGNAATFEYLGDLAKAVPLLERAIALAPGDARWYRSLGDTYGALAHDRPELWSRASAAYERFLAHETDPKERWWVLADAARAAARAGENIAAEKLARELLAAKDPYGAPANDKIHEAHLVLGEVALAKGDMAAAKEHLLAAAAAVPTSRAWRIIGPGMRLAELLLERGERDTVLAFLDRCASWEITPKLLAEWRGAIEAGRKPDFHGRAFR